VPIIGLEDEIRELAQQIVENAAEALMSDLLEDAPVATGELLDSAYGPEIDADGLSATVGFGAPQSDWTDQGVAPHGIDGNPTMTFFWPDGPEGPGVYSYNHVNHPGQEATHWFSDRVDEWDSYVQEAADAS
jgi:hypothetical protein